MADRDDRWTPSIKGKTIEELQASTNEVVKLIYQYLHLLEGRVGPAEIRDDLSILGKVRMPSPIEEPEVGEEGEIALYYDGEEILKSVEGADWESLVPEAAGHTEAVRLWAAGSTTLAPATPTILNFDTEVLDTDSMFDPFDPSKITFTTAGTYIFGATVEFDISSPPDIEPAFLTILKNGVTQLCQGTSFNEGGTGVQASITVSGLAEFAALDYLQCLVYYRDGGFAGRDVVSSAQFTPVFWAHRLS